MLLEKWWATNPEAVVMKLTSLFRGSCVVGLLVSTQACGVGPECLSHSDCPDTAYCNGGGRCEAYPEDQGTEARTQTRVVTGERSPPTENTGTALGNSGLDAALEVGGGLVSGDIGPALDVNNEVPSPSVAIFDGRTYINLQVTRPNGGDAMVVINLEGTLGELVDETPPGQDVPVSTTDVSFNGCAQLVDGSWRFDTPAETINVRVDELGENTFRVSFRARLAPNVDGLTGTQYPASDGLGAVEFTRR
ncbi:MAG: hypothetical protein AB2A00_02635 [Myxococcota bacterium]